MSEVVGKNVRRLRQEQGFTQQELADLMALWGVTWSRPTVAQMESGQLKLDDCVAQFEKGAKLAGWCSAKLAETEKKIEVLVAESDLGLQWRPLDNEG